jgi:hypothetical protein
MTGIELFSGHGTISSVFNLHGHNCLSIDNRRRKGICEPGLKADIMTLTARQIKDKYPDLFPLDFLWASPVCTAFSYGAGDYYFKNGIPNERAPYFIKLLYKSLLLIEELRPAYFFIENPRGRMRYQKCLIDFLCRNNGSIKLITLSSYGFSTIKPTDIFTNAHDYTPRASGAYGRGAKNPGKDFQDLTVCSRQKTPRPLAEEILSYMESKLSRTSSNVSRSQEAEVSSS